MKKVKVKIDLDQLAKENGFKLAPIGDRHQEKINVSIDLIKKSLSGTMTAPIVSDFFSEEKKEDPYNRPYKTVNGTIIWATGETSGFGINNVGEWDTSKSWASFNETRIWTPATTEEWQATLIEYAKKRGYKNGNYKCLYVPCATFKIKNADYCFSYEDLWIDDNESGNSNKIFDGETGEWAEIIEQEQEVKEVNCAPGGIVPEYIHKQNRVNELISGINRYNQAGLKVPIKWHEELNTLLSILLKK